jgi:UDP-N-acetylglucosamine 2-epimerase (non-hydrolysing)
MPLKVLTVVGTRPEIIRLSRVIARLENSFDHVLVHTGQNYDDTLSGIFFREFQLREPDYYLDVASDSLGATLGNILSKIEPVLIKEKPDAFLVLGDTNSAITSLIAKRMQIPVFHMEAGNRSFDENVPEETNRRFVDHISDFNLVYTEHARRNLLAEGLHPSRIQLTGSPMLEVLNFNKDRILGSKILDEMNLVPRSYILVSAHREENVDNPLRLQTLITSLEKVGQKRGCKVLVSTHPRTRNRIEALLSSNESRDSIIFHEPFGFFDYCKLQIESLCVLSDSGTISEESSNLGFPAVTLREAIERPEALDTGSMIMAGVDFENIDPAISLAVESEIFAKVPVDYQVDDTSLRVARFIQSVAPFHSSWSGLYNRQ